MGRKVSPLVDDKNEIQGYIFHCPGCGYSHVFYTKPQTPGGATWSFNGSLESPTFAPSLRVYHPEHDGKPEKTLCHLFVRDGRIEYLTDSAHDLRGQTIEMQDDE